MKVLKQHIPFLSGGLILTVCSIGVASANNEYAVAQAEADITAAQIAMSNSLQSKYPFIGERYFDFVGANDTMNGITIDSNGYTTLEMFVRDSSLVMYKGDYSPVMPAFDGETYYAIIGNNAIAQLDSKGNLMYGDGCNILEGKPCVTELFLAD